MSHIVMPDPHPGRCQNHRTHIGPNGEIEQLRCLDYEAVPHVCSFPEPKSTYGSLTWGGGSVTYKTPKPTPWVKP